MMAHLLSCRLLDEACTADDLATVTERTKAWPAGGRTYCVKDTTEEEYCLLSAPFLVHNVHVVVTV